jgi:hypothetical protein
LGYTVAAEFYSPKYETEAQKSSDVPDRRTTLLWKPNIQSDDAGNASFDFYTSDHFSGCSIVIEGVTTTGEVIYKTGELN